MSAEATAAAGQRNPGSNQGSNQGNGGAKPVSMPSAESTMAERLAFLEARAKVLEAENAGLKARKQGQALTLRVSAKKALSVYGLGRWPVTLYASQWRRLLGEAERVTAFLAEHKGELAEEREG